MKSGEQFEIMYGFSLTKRKHREIIALFLSLELIMANSSLGFVQIPPLSITTLHILVIVVAMYFGPVDAMIESLVFAIASMWKASMTAIEAGDLLFSPLLSGKPVQSILMAAGARVAFAGITGLMFRKFSAKPVKYKRLGIAGITVASTVIHSVLVYACMMAFFGTEGRNTTGFSLSFIANNAIMYALTIFMVIGFDQIMRSKRIRDFFTITADAEKQVRLTRSRYSIILISVILVCSAGICVHFMTRLQWYIQEKGTNIDSGYIAWNNAVLFQFLVGYAAIFIVVALCFRWNRDYFSALTLQANIKAIESAEQANKAKSSFLFTMSHDIRTPMNAIMGFTNMARKHIDDRNRVIDCLNKTQQSGNLLLSLINNVLEVSRIESGKATVDEQCGDIYLSFAQIEDTLHELANTKDIQLTFAFGEIHDRYVYADISHCIRVFVNIISNAIKYTPEGGMVQVKCAQIGESADGIGRYCYTVQDNGIGMSEEFQKHVFEQFSRENTATVSGIEGTGLGLAVCKSFVDIMGGTISCDSQQGSGTTFTVILPFRIQTEGEKFIDPITGDIVLASEGVRVHKPADFHGERVLLVDDNELNREIALDILGDAGIDADEAVNGSDAVDKVRTKGPDYYHIILMDIQMPVMNGYEATKEIRRMYPDRHIPIIALSANAFSEDIQKSLEAGMDAHISKPINVKDCFGTLAKFL